MTVALAAGVLVVAVAVPAVDVVVIVAEAVPRAVDAIAVHAVKLRNKF
ncbi:MAG: hypothetical protein WDO18_07805 [Acidobacteriota bacterium]